MNLLPLLLLALPLVSCQSKTTEPVIETTDSATEEREWTSLFDGNTFDHWRGYGQEAMPEAWIVDDGAMFASKPGAGMDIVSRETYTDFELELEWKVSEGGNSGIMWHVDESAGNYPWMTGPEYQLLDDAVHNGGQIGKNSAGANYDVQEPSTAMTKAAGEWNTTRIVVNGTSVEHWLNGTMVVAYTKGSDDHKRRVAESKWAEMDSYGSTSTGHIAFQGDHGEVWFRNLRIRSLSK
jgi:hypothetical protein